MDEVVERIANQHGIDIPNLRKGDAETENICSRLEDRLKGTVSEDVDIGVAVHGSLARGEYGQGSDCDYVVLVGSGIDVEQTLAVSVAMAKAEKELFNKKPGAQGIFGDVVLEAELVGKIGLQGDTNANTTRRLLLLLESRSIYNSDFKDRLVRAILDRYLVDYRAKNRANDSPIRVPRFLLNDLTRYWRMVAVDFGAKQWTGSEPRLRHAKLLVTRKVLFAGTLMSLFFTNAALGDQTDKEAAHERLIEYLSKRMALSPLGRLLDPYASLEPSSQENLRRIIGAYDTFVGLVATEDGRDSIEQGNREDQVSEITTTIGESLDTLFFEDEALRSTTTAFGLF